MGTSGISPEPLQEKHGVLSGNAPVPRQRGHGLVEVVLAGIVPHTLARIANLKQA